MMGLFKKNKTDKPKCELCKIIKEGENFLIAENEVAIAFLAPDPIEDGHILVASKKHYLNLMLTDEKIIQGVFSLMKYTANLLEKNLEIKNINYIFNEGYIAGQKYNHFYFNVIPKRNSDEGLIISEKKYLEDVAKVYETILKKIKKK